MNLGNAPASMGSSYAGLYVKSIAFIAAGTHLAGPKAAYCSASHDASCCANQMPITECIASQPEACYPWLQKLIGENLFTQRQDFFFRYFCPRIFSYGIIRVSLLTLYQVRIHAACLIVHGSIGECVVTSKDGILSLRTARHVLASPRTGETAFSAAPCL